MSIGISLIVPAYNASKFLGNAISSIQRSLAGVIDFEIIIVNDGSMDNTQEIACACQDALGSDIVKVIHQANAGLSGARNTGIKVARGRFLAFLDADDELTLDAGCLLRRAIALDADIVEFGYILKRENGELRSCAVSEIQPESTRLALDGSLLLASARMSKWYAWARLYRAELFSHREFAVGRYFEDFECIPYLYRAAKTIAHINEPLIIYISTPGSITKVAKKKYAEDLLLCSRQFYAQSRTDKAHRHYWAHLAQRAYFIAMQAASNARAVFDEGTFMSFRRDHFWTLWTWNFKYIKYFLMWKSIMRRKIRRKEIAGKSMPVAM